jgi:hypothetical protein
MKVESRELAKEFRLRELIRVGLPLTKISYRGYAEDFLLIVPVKHP